MVQGQEGKPRENKNWKKEAGKIVREVSQVLENYIKNLPG